MDEKDIERINRIKELQDRIKRQLLLQLALCQNEDVIYLLNRL